MSFPPDDAIVYKHQLLTDGATVQINLLHHPHHKQDGPHLNISMMVIDA